MNRHKDNRLTQPRRIDRHRGSALILVVAVLGILFVAGAALLSSVTFSTKSLQTERITRENQAAVDAVETMVTGMLRKGFLGPDGNPYNAQSELAMHQPGDPLAPCDTVNNCVVTLPANGEAPGVQPWIDLTEPYEENPAANQSALLYKLYSSFTLGLRDLPLDGPSPARTMNPLAPVRVDMPHTLGFGDQDSAADLQRDADGDGVVDSFELVLPTELLPPDLQRAVGDRLRDGSAGPAGNLDELRLTLRIIPTGAMANLNWSHSFLRRTALDMPYFPTGQYPDDSQLFTGVPYLAESNEWLLRSRGLVPPRVLPTSWLLQDLTEPLLRPHASVAGVQTAALLGAGNRRWWMYDSAADTLDAGSPWRMLMNPEQNQGVYDVIHNVTTASYDDLLIRGKRDPQTGRDAIDTLAALDNNNSLNLTYTAQDRLAWDNYPYVLDGRGDPRLGRIKLSLPYMDTVLGEGLTIGELDTTVGPQERQRFVRTIQEAFLLMLNGRDDYDANGLPDRYQASADQQRIKVDQSVTAAMLTANLLDFADSNSTPIRVEVINTNGLFVAGADGATPLAVYGFEQQPYITEVYALVSWMPPVPPNPPMLNAAGSAFAIELYNPYDVDIPLSGFGLFDAYTGAATPLRTAAGTAGLNASFTTEIVRAHSFLTVYSDAPFAQPASLTEPSVAVAGADDWVVDEESRIQLRRVVGGGQTLVTDEFRVKADVPGAVTVGTPNASTNALSVEASWQRDSSESAPGLSNWRFIVPEAGQYVGAGHTLGSINAWVNPNIYPVHVDVRNAGTLRSAYPTTGALLLLSRMAHVFDGSAQTPWTSPFNRVDTNHLVLRNMVDDFDQIDNGRMPVFDVAPPAIAPRYHVIPGVTLGTVPVPGRVEGTNALPWGQLIFDYFTALPLDPPLENDPLQPEGNQPRVDQHGLRVYGRINLNAAPWRVLAGLPLVPLERFQFGSAPNAADDPVVQEMAAALGIGVTTQTILGEDLAKAIVGYREARDMSVYTAGNYQADRDPRGAGAAPTYRPRLGYGFATVGELLNVRHPGAGGQFRLDRGAFDAPRGTPEASYIRAVSTLVALGDWVTTKSHVFTIYGTLRGQYVNDPTNPNFATSTATADQQAIRFQTTIDRLPMFLGGRAERVGAQVTGGYRDVR